jgi:hypothetical protein
MEYGNTTITGRADLITHAQIVMRSKAPDGDFPFTDNLVTTTSRHEIGHALGISWHSANANDVMYFSMPIADKEVEISKRDVNTLLKLYSIKLPWPSLYADFIANPNNLKLIAAIIGVILSLTLVILLIEINRRKKKKR